MGEEGETNTHVCGIAHVKTRGWASRHQGKQVRLVTQVVMLRQGVLGTGSVRRQGGSESLPFHAFLTLLPYHKRSPSLLPAMERGILTRFTRNLTHTRSLRYQGTCKQAYWQVKAVHAEMPVSFCGRMRCCSPRGVPSAR